MPIHTSSISCGVHQHYGLGHTHRRYSVDGQITVVPHGYLDRLILDLAEWGGLTAIVAFSDADVNGNGRETAREIRTFFPDAKLVETSSTNPNSGNKITAYLWAPDWADVARYCRQYGLDSAAPRFENTRAVQRRYEPASSPWA